MTTGFIRKILLPVDFPAVSTSVLEQAVGLAEHFDGKLVMLHVTTPESHAAGVPADERGLANWDLLAAILRTSGRDMNASLRSRLSARVSRAMLVHGDPARAIVTAAEAENADLIMMPSHGFTFDRFLLGSVTAKVLRWKHCPVWTGAHIEEPRDTELSLHNILCAVDLGPRSHEAATWAARFAQAFGARLTLGHVAESVAIFAPGGTWADPNRQQDILDDASERLAELRRTFNLGADLLIGVGDVPRALSQMTRRTRADLLILDCYPCSENLRMHAYPLICAVPIPVISI